MRGSEQVYIGLGANVGPARHTLERAIADLAALPGAELNGVSDLYRTRPVGLVAQADFLNAVVGLRLPAHPDAVASALDLLGTLKDLEQRLGRRRRERWGPREIDADLLLYGMHHLGVEGVLEVPHPRARERLFVLAPLADLAAALEPPGWGETVAQARDRARETQGPGAVLAIAPWDPAAGRWDPAVGRPHEAPD